MPTHPSRKTSGSVAARPTRRWRESDADARAALITEAALRLLQRKGLEAVTMRAVAAKLGVGAMTLYTYIDGQRGLRLAMIRAGFDLLHVHCKGASTLECGGSWRGSAEAYVRFAIEHPNLYQLMFASPFNKDELDLLAGGFEPLLERVAGELAAQGVTGKRARTRAQRAAGPYWVALHGLATLAIAERLSVVGDDWSALLDALLEKVAPT